MNRSPTSTKRHARRARQLRNTVLAAVLAALLPACALLAAIALRARLERSTQPTQPRDKPLAHAPRLVAPAFPVTLSRKLPHTIPEKIVAAARRQVGTLYDQEYVTIAYPNGDVPPGPDGTPRGACTDVIVRALRGAGYDLQRLLHEDMRRARSAYPRQYGAHLDPSIDHRRVPNQMVFFKRHGLSLPREVSPHTLSQWQPGDIVCWKFPNTLDHTGIVSDARDASGVPLVIHNCGVCAEEDVLTVWPIQGHFRFPTR